MNNGWRGGPRICSLICLLQQAWPWRLSGRKNLETNVLISFLLYWKGLRHTLAISGALKWFAKPKSWCSDSPLSSLWAPKTSHKELFKNEAMPVHLFFPSPMQPSLTPARSIWHCSPRFCSPHSFSILDCGLWTGETWVSLQLSHLGPVWPWVSLLISLFQFLHA